MRGHGAVGCQASGGAQRHRAPGRAPSRKGTGSFQDERRSGTTPGSGGWRSGTSGRATWTPTVRGARHRGCPAQHSRRIPGSTGAASEAATEAQEETSAGRSGQCGRGHPEKGRSGLTGPRNPRNVLPRAQEIGTADRPMVERLELVLTWGGRFSEEDRGADHTAAI